MARMASVTSRISFFLAVGFLGALATPAGAVTTYAKFYYGGNGYTGAYSTSAMYLNTKGLGIDCPTSGGGCGPADNVLNSAMVIGGKGITFTANPGNKPWGDFSPNFGGIGVGSGSPSSSDQIGTSTDVPSPLDILTMTFTNQVKLEGIGTLFDAGHTTFGTSFTTQASVVAAASTIQFQIRVDGGSWQDIKFANANAISLSLVGTVFDLREKDSRSPEFYVSALAWETCGPQGAECGPGRQTPIPGALPLFSTGVGLIGLLGWRRKRRAQ